MSAEIHISLLCILKHNHIQTFNANYMQHQNKNKNGFESLLTYFEVWTEAGFDIL